jgi:hypothetical protein
MSDIELTEREKAIAKEAARIAVEDLAEQFYKQVGKTIVNKVLVWVGAIVVGFILGKGWDFKV